MVAKKVWSYFGRRPRRLCAVLAVAGGLLVAAAPASADVTGYFCNGNFLPSGASCHSRTWHSSFLQVSGSSTNNYPTCVGIDVELYGGTLVNVCSSGGVDCIGYGCEYSGYAYVHNHGRIGDNYRGYLHAYM
jgi:hypothetical protein